MKRFKRGLFIVAAIYCTIGGVYGMFVIPGMFYPMLLLFAIALYFVADEPGSRGWVCRLAKKRGWTGLYRRYRANESSYWSGE